MGDLNSAFGEGDSDEPTELQQDILKTAERNPDMKQNEIAEVVGCSSSHVSKTFKKYGDPRESGSSSIGTVGWLLILGFLALLAYGATQDAKGALVVVTTL